MRSLSDGTGNSVDDIYENYLELDGKMDRQRFEKVFTVFVALTADVYTGGDIPEHYLIEAELNNINVREVAWGYWEQFMMNIGQPWGDSARVFEAADAFSAYS